MTNFNKRRPNSEQDTPLQQAFSAYMKNVADTPSGQGDGDKGTDSSDTPLSEWDVEPETGAAIPGPGDKKGLLDWSIFGRGYKLVRNPEGKLVWVKKS